MRSFRVVVCLVSCSIFFACNAESPLSEHTAGADLVLLGGSVYTMEPDQPWAEAIVIEGNHIEAVSATSDEARSFVGPDTRVVDLEGAFVVPGFIDGHIHFDSAGALLTDINLLRVSDERGLRLEVARVVGNLEDDEWIVGGMWGAYEQWRLGATEAEGEPTSRWLPDRTMIDDVTGANPCLLSSFDRELYLANTPALEAAGLVADPSPGMELRPDGSPSGLIRAPSGALERIRERIQPKSHQRLLAENRAALEELALSGIVEVHDIAKPEQTARLMELQQSGELTCRFWLRPDLSRGAELDAAGLTMGLHPETKQPDPWLRYGALKGYIDGIMGTHGALFFDPYDDQPENYGHYRPHTSDDPDYATGNMEKMYGLLTTARTAGFVANVHAIGTKGTALMLDTYERLMRDVGHDLEGYRVIHAQVIRPQDFPRFKELNVIAEVNPYHLSDDMRWMEERIGHERCRGAYAFRSLLDNGAALSFGSDWPGTSAAYYHVHPRYLIHAAVNRTTLGGEPEGGWFPEQKISVHEALEAYTINNARAAFEDDIRGSIKAGKLADITVVDRNLIEIDPTEILDMEVVMTIVDGRVVFERSTGS